MNEPQATQDSFNRNYNTISPSAKSLLLMKGLTSIPFAKQAAALLVYPETYDPNVKDRDAGFWARVVHFENRYRSVDQLLKDLDISNILELSSGFSFRGLDIIKQNKVYYIDTDLDEVIKLKNNFISSLQEHPSVGTLETLALNALDENQFNDVVSHFPDGQIVILNEGLLMYLNLEEKNKLCAIIHKTLQQRGGYWITADIYRKKQVDVPHINTTQQEREFFERHRVEENKFESFDEAKSFFYKAGFIIDQEAKPDASGLSSLNHFLNSVTTEQISNLRKAGRIQVSWRLKAR